MKNSFLKILCLAVGLTLGLVLLAKVCFIEEFDSCIPDRERGRPRFPSKIRFFENVEFLDILDILDNLEKNNLKKIKNND